MSFNKKPTGSSQDASRYSTQSMLRPQKESRVSSQNLEHAQRASQHFPKTGSRLYRMHLDLLHRAPRVCREGLESLRRILDTRRGRFSISQRQVRASSERASSLCRETLVSAQSRVSSLESRDYAESRGSVQSLESLHRDSSLLR